MKMQIEIITDETKESRKVWRFDYFTGYGHYCGAMLGHYAEHRKEPGKRKWVTINFWDRIDNRSCNLKVPPTVPDDLKILVLQEFAKSLKFQD